MLVTIHKQDARFYSPTQGDAGRWTGQRVYPGGLLDTSVTEEASLIPTPLYLHFAPYNLPSPAILTFYPTSTVLQTILFGVLHHFSIQLSMVGD
jgi:hypothetical protein